MDRLTKDLLEDLRNGPVKRARITSTLSIERGVAALLQREAKSESSVVLRYNKGKQQEVAYQFRPARLGEQAGDLIEIDE